MGKSPLRRGGAKAVEAEASVPVPTRLMVKNLKLLTAFALFAALLAAGHALNPAAPASGASGQAIASETASAEPGAPSPAGASGTKAVAGHDAPSPDQPALPGKVRNILLGLAALGIAVLGAVTARLISGGSQPERDGFLRHSGFRHSSDRAAFGRACVRRGGAA